MYKKDPLLPMYLRIDETCETKTFYIKIGFACLCIYTALWYFYKYNTYSNKSIEVYDDPTNNHMLLSPVFFGSYEVV